MAVGVGALTCYQGEDVDWEFTLTDALVTDISTWLTGGSSIEWKIKATAASSDPALLSGTCVIPGSGSPPTLKYNLRTGIDIDPGSYVVSIRRTGTSVRWQTDERALTVLDTGSVD